jgi:hypothetical protein
LRDNIVPVGGGGSQSNELCHQDDHSHKGVTLDETKTEAAASVTGVPYRNTWSQSLTIVGSPNLLGILLQVHRINTLQCFSMFQINLASFSGKASTNALRLKQDRKYMTKVLYVVLWV